MQLKRYMIGLAIAASLAVPASASAQDYEEACGANPATQTVEVWLTHHMTVTRYELADKLPAAMASLDVVDKYFLEENYEFAYITGREYWQRYKDNDQDTYDDCVRQVDKAVADEAKQDRADKRERDRIKRNRQRNQNLRCQSIGGVRIWKNRPDVSCATARKLARLGRTTTSYKGWHRSFHESGYWSYRLEQRVDRYGEVHTYRVPVDPYMQADWRKGKAKITLAGGICDSKDCVLDPRRGN